MARGFETTPGQRGLKVNQRKCGDDDDPRWQMMVIKGNNFAGGTGAKIHLQAKRQVCDCPNVGGKPCMHIKSRYCMEKRRCSWHFHLSVETVDCDSNLGRKMESSKTIELVESITHRHDEIWVQSMPGFGRSIKLDVIIDDTLAGTSSYRYNRPHVLKSPHTMKQQLPGLTRFTIPKASSALYLLGAILAILLQQY